MLSAGVAFAADDTADVVAVDDEITIDESLAVEEVQAVSGGSSETVYINESNIDQYIDESGKINENVTADEFVFVGSFNDLNLTVDRSITLTGGNDSYFYNPNIQIYSSNVLLQNFTIVQDKGVNSIFVAGYGNATSNVSILGVDIAFGDNQNGAGAIPIEVINSDNFSLGDSSIFYAGRTDGSYLNNVVRIVNSRNAVVYNNKIVADLISLPVSWVEEEGVWVSNPVSEAIVFKNSTDAIFDSNNVTVYCVNATGFYDTVYVIDVSGDDAIVTNNEIDAYGQGYLYDVILSGDNFIIRSNDINATAIDYANGIDIEGPAKGIVEFNNINVKAVSSAYAIYSGMNGANVSANYTENNISGEAYNIFGFSLGDVESNVVNNTVLIDGNYTTGIAFKGSRLTVEDNLIVLLSSEEGDEYVWDAFGVDSRGITALSGEIYIINNRISTSGTGIDLVGTGFVEVTNNIINVVANVDKDAYAIHAVNSSSSIIINENLIDYQGSTNGTGINYAVYLVGTTPLISYNNFSLELVSSYVPWNEVPAGSGNYVSSPISEGIVIEDSNHTLIAGNNVSVTYNGIVGDYDTIYTIDVRNSDDAIISSNVIEAEGYSYIYGIIISGNNFNIEDNNITVTSDVYYADGIDIEGPASGKVTDNRLDVTAVTAAYGIYSGMNGQDVSVNYTHNGLFVEAYLVIGMSLGDVESNIYDSSIFASGNYTKGIAYRGSKLTVNDTIIWAMGSNVGDQYVWEGFGVDTFGIKVVQGNSIITNNDIRTSANYAIEVMDNPALVHDNNLVAKRFAGDDSVNNDKNSEVYNNTPVITNKTRSSISILEVDGECNIVGVVTDENGEAMDGITVRYYLDGVAVGSSITNKFGLFLAGGLSNGYVEIVSFGDSYTSNATANITLQDIAPLRDATVINSTDYTTYAIDSDAGESGNFFKVQLLDEFGAPLANKDVQIGFNGKIYNRTTNESGWAELQINLKKEGVYTFAIAFLGDDYYNASFTIQKITVNKKKTSISASAKSYKASAKTKKYTVTLKTDKGSSIDGKTYLKSGKKITLKINGKTYTAKTNSKGQATFSLKITKKGKFSATVKFAGDSTYAASSKKVTITIK